MRCAGPRIALGVVAVLACALVAPDDARAGTVQQDDVDSESDELFPGLRVRDAVRLWIDSRFLPGAHFDDGVDVSLVEPGVRLRVRAPIGSRIATQLTGDFRTNRYDVDGGSLFSDCASCPAPDDFYAGTIGAQAAFLLNPEAHLLFDGEHWALLAGAFGRARWESGAFADSLTGGGAAGVGYELPGRLRLALGVRVESALDGGSPSISPTGTFRLDLTHGLRLRNRGLGGQLELRRNRFEVFLAGYRTTDHFLFRSRGGTPNDTVFRDRRWQAGAGVEWKLWRRLRAVVEGGVVLDRELSVEDRDGKLSSVSGDPSPYAGVRLEIRP